MFLFYHTEADVILNDLYRSHNGSDVGRAINAWCAHFAHAGLSSGDVLALVMRNRVEFIEVVLAALQAGLTVVPLNWHLQANELQQLLEDCQPDLIVSELYFQQLLSGGVDELLFVEYLPILSAKDDMSDVYHADMPAGRIMLYTGGTTGLPKAVARQGYPSLGALFDGYCQLGRDSGLTGSGGHLVAGPLYHAAPLYFALYDFLNGAPLTIMPFWDAEMALSIIDKRQIRRSHMVPTQLIHLLKLPESIRSAYALDTIELILHGAAAMPVAVKQQLLSWFGPVLTEYWGGSESGICTRINSHEWQRKTGSVGQAVAHYQLRIKDRQSGQLCKANDVGLIQIRHQSGVLPFAYAGRKKQAIEELGWFDLGDVGYMDNDGYLFLSDREKNKIIRGGVNIYPAEIEKHLLALPCVLDVAVVGVPDDELGERVVALVQFSASSEGIDLKSVVRRHLQAIATFKRPEVLYVIDDLQRMPNGKIRGAELQAGIERKEYRYSVPLRERLDDFSA